MTEHEAKRIVSAEENGVVTGASLMERMESNAKSSIFPEIEEVLAQRKKQSGGSKINVDVPGFSHVDHAVEQVMLFEDPNVTDARIPSSLLQTPLPSEAESTDGVVFRGPMDIADERVQKRINHIFALIGATRNVTPPKQEAYQVLELESKTTLAPDIFLIEERSKRTIALRLQRKIT